MDSELRKVMRPLGEQVNFYRRLSLARYVWEFLFPDSLKSAAVKDWDTLANESDEIFTHQLADILENNASVYLTFHLYPEKVKQVADYICYGNSLLETQLPENLQVEAYKRALLIVSQHILKNM